LCKRTSKRLELHQMTDYPKIDTSILKVKYPTGRKICGGPCGRWRHTHEYHVSKKIQFPDGTISIQRLQSWCSTCQRENTRKVVGIKRQGKPYKPQVAKWGDSGPKRAARKRELYNRRKERAPKTHARLLAERRAVYADRQERAKLVERLLGDVEQRDCA
jgi:hypothetical protein